MQKPHLQNRTLDLPLVSPLLYSLGHPVADATVPNESLECTLQVRRGSVGNHRLTNLTLESLKKFMSLPCQLEMSSSHRPSWSERRSLFDVQSCRFFGNSMINALLSPYFLQMLNDQWIRSFDTSYCLTNSYVSLWGLCCLAPTVLKRVLHRLHRPPRYAQVSQADLGDEPRHEKPGTAFPRKLGEADEMLGCEHFSTLFRVP